MGRFQWQAGSLGYLYYPNGIGKVIGRFQWQASSLGYLYYPFLKGIGKVRGRFQWQAVRSANLFPIFALPYTFERHRKCLMGGGA